MFYFRDSWLQFENITLCSNAIVDDDCSDYAYTRRMTTVTIRRIDHGEFFRN